MSDNKLPAVRNDQPLVPAHEIRALYTALEAPTPASYARRPLLVGLVVVIGLVFGLATWSATVPLASATVASGQIVANSSRKTIQHLEGGIIRTIAVEEGELVRAGEPLVVIDDTQARAQFDIVRSQYLALKAREARLIAERDGLGEVAFEHPVFEETDIGGHAQAIAGQKKAFAARQKAISSQVDINSQRIAQLDEQIIGLQAQVTSADRQLELIQEEYKDVKGLYEKGHERKPRLLALERTMAEIAGTRGSYVAQIAQARQAIVETELKNIDLTTQFNNEVVRELGEVQTEIADLEERFRSLTDRVERAIVRAPIDGIVVNLRVHTQGGVIPPGGDIMDLVPAHDELVVEAQVRPEDVDSVRIGLQADVRVTAFDQRSVPSLSGRLTLVSADRLEDKRTGQPYYNARIQLDPASMARLDGLELQPGMPVEVMIKTGERPLLEALISPIVHSFNRSFREG